MLSAIDVLVLLVSGLLLALIRRQEYRKRRMAGYPLPPTRKGLPIFGNAFQLPSRLQWLTYSQWAKEMNSDIVYLNAAGTSIIVVSSLKIVRDLFDQRSSIYSSRAQSIMKNELMGWDWLISSLPYGDRWRERRRLFQKYFHPQDTASHRPREVEIVRRMLSELLKTPDNLSEHIRYLVGGITLTLAYGIPIRATNDPFIDLAEKATKPGIEAAVPGAFLVDVIPLLKYVPDWFPGAAFQRKAKIWRKLTEKFLNEPFVMAERGIASATVQPSLVSKSLDQIDTDEDVEHQRTVIKDVAAIFFAAGSDTTLASIQHFFLAMICYPEVQVKAQKELDEVLGGHRLPDFSDEERLPYISAIIKEVLRWRPVLAIGVPHVSTEDDVYNGYFIPKDSIVIPNVWAILYDEIEYPQPSVFRPERFIKDGRLRTDIRDPATVAFGFGRRICPGAHIATSTLWLTAASVLSAFEISKAVDEDGIPIEPSAEPEPGLISRPKAFKCNIKPRSKVAEALIQSIEIDA